MPLEILEALSSDEDARIRSAVATKRKAFFGILQRLAHDANSGVRNAVAWNAKAPRAVLETMLDDEWHVIVEPVRKRLAESA